MRSFRTRERTRDWVTFRTDLPAGVLVPAPARRRWPGIVAAAVPAPLLRPVRRIARSVAVEVCVAVAMAMFLAAAHHTMLAQLSPPRPPAAICGTSLLNGPSSAPPGAVTVPAGDNTSEFDGVTLPPDTTYWFATGTHTLGIGEFNQIIPSQGDVFLGAPGAVLDGQDSNDYAFTGYASGVTIEYLTIQDFTPPGGQGAVDHNAADSWTIEYNTIQDILPGSGVYLGSFSTLDWNCITENGDQGFGVTGCVTCSNLTGGPLNTAVDDNEISYNDTCNWEDVPTQDFPITPPAGCAGAGQFAGCGCSGAGKFWETDISQFDNNYVHDNYSFGPWWDTNNVGGQAVGNYISGNYAQGMIYEISYNGYISGNIFVDNLQELGVYGLSPGGFSYGALYISESGADPRVAGPYSSQFVITGNQFWNNFGGIALWENPDRFCGGPAGDKVCTLVNGSAPTAPQGSPQPPRGPQPWRRGLPPPGRTYGNTPGGYITWGWDNLGPCETPGVISVQPYNNDCRWHTQNVSVTGNFFDFTPSAVGPYCTAANFCGYNGIFSNSADNPYYPGDTTEVNITFSQDNQFARNTYCGPWNFTIEALNNQVNFATWQGAPYGQDPSSTLNGAACSGIQPPPAGPPRAPVPRPAQMPVYTGRW